MEKAFTSILLHWHEHENHRAMPWKGEKDPYKIWLSEIILQQTRVEQGWAYYEKYIKAFPTVRDLAAAPDETVLKMWEGLGYYSRCRNLLYTARMIVNEFDGHFPSDYKELLRLKGVGAYTAAAIASFAFNLPYAVVDGNVIRVLSRYFGITEPTDLTHVKRELDTLAQRLIDPHKAAAYNQAIMDFGATICKPQLALCSSCVFQKNCYAKLNDCVQELPVKSKKIVIKQRFFEYFILHDDNGLFIRCRKQKDVWQDLYEFVLEEHTEEKLLFSKKLPAYLEELSLDSIQFSSEMQMQKLTHQHIAAAYHFLKFSGKKPSLKGYTYVSLDQLKDFPFPSLLNTFLTEQLKKGNF